MQTHWLTQEPGHDKLMIVALGWAGSPAAAPAAPPGYDMLCLYDYRSLAVLDPADYARYSVIDLAAWSFGVLMAQLVCARLSLHCALAFNGSPKPLDDRFGIPKRVFCVTQKGIRQSGVGLFFKRAYGGLVPPSHLPQRGLAELADELDALAAAADNPAPGGVAWNGALIGSRDAIFPPQNLHAYWGKRAVAFDAPHYPFADTAWFHRLYARLWV